MPKIILTMNYIYRIQNWMASNKLMIKPSKSQVLIFPYSQKQSLIDLNVTIIDQY